MPNWKDKIKSYEKEYLEDLEKLVSAPSVRDLSTSADGAPFGQGIRKAFDCFLEISERCGFETEDFGGYACHAQTGKGEAYVGVLGHLDVVGILQPEQWETQPFTLCRKGDVLYGRGVNDDKGPLLAALYAARIVREAGEPLKRELRVIAGGAEETTWECMEHYFSRNSQPILGFSPDGNFPIVNGEKGIAKFELIFPSEKENPLGEYRLREIRCSTLENYVCSDLFLQVERAGLLQDFSWEGKKALSRNPQRGENALWKFAKAFQGKSFVQPEVERLLLFLEECLTGDAYGKKSGLYSEDREMGTTSVCPTGIRMDEKGLHLYLDLRYPKSTDEKRLQNKLEELGKNYGFQTVLVYKKRLLYVPEESELIVSLKKAYERVTGQEAFAFTKGGASYARTLDRGVAFGATFEGEETKPHMPNECMACSSIWKAMEIYCEALWQLAVKC